MRYNNDLPLRFWLKNGSGAVRRHTSRPADSWFGPFDDERELFGWMRANGYTRQLAALERNVAREEARQRAAHERTMSFLARCAQAGAL